MAYDEKKPIRVPMRPSPSAIYNNLTLSGGHLLYAHTRQACTLSPASATAGQPISVRRVESKHTDFVHCVRAMSHNEVTYVLVGTEAGIQIWDKQASLLLFVWALPPMDSAASAAARSAAFVRGAAINIAADGSPTICFGSSTGTMYVLEFDESGRFQQPIAYPQGHTSPITCMGSAYQSRQGRWTEDLGVQLVSCDEEGNIVVWEAASARGYKVVSKIGAPGTPVTSVAVRNGFAIAARLDGCVQVFGLKDGKLRAEMAAHGRFLTAMDIHPSKDLIATVGEDSVVGVWTLPIGAQKAQCLLSATWMHALPSGVAFCGPTLDDVAAVAYDTDELQIFKLARPT